MRSRPRRPIMTAIKNPCSCKGAPAPERETNPVTVVGGSGTALASSFGRPWWWGGGSPWWGGYGWPYAAPYSYAYGGAPAADVWLPATKGPAPQGVSVWVLWTGGSTGTKVRAGSPISEQVQILETAKGGVTGTLVRTAPLAVAAPAYPQFPYAASYPYPFAYSLPAAVVVRR